MAGKKIKTLKIDAIMGTSEPEIRYDDQGEGYFGAKRGSRTHTGVDLACRVGSTVTAPVHGKITKIGYPYVSGVGGVKENTSKDRGPFRYVQITVGEGDDRKHVRLFYVVPMCKVGDNVRPGQQIGAVDNIADRYEGMTPHVHLEIMSKGRKFEDPAEYDWPERRVTAQVSERRRGRRTPTNG